MKKEKKNMSGLNFNIEDVSDFSPPKTDKPIRKNEMARNAEFYKIMHQEDDNKIDKIFKQVSPPIKVSLPTIKTSGDKKIIEETFDFDDEIIGEVQKNKSKVVRFYDGGNDIKTEYYDKRDKYEPCDDFKSGVKSSYLVRTTLFFNQNLGKLSKKSRSEIYCTGFCFPDFKKDCCKKFFTSNDFNLELKDLLKSAFKLQIYATLEARQQQIDDGEIINKEVKVPLILNKPYDFIKNLDKEKVDKIRMLTRQALIEIFKDLDVRNAVKGKIDRVFLFDKPKKGEPGYDNKNVDEAEKAFFTCEDGDFGPEIQMHRMPNKDILDLANKYKNNQIRIAVPVMKHPTDKDGNKMDLGYRSMEEILAMQSGYFFPAYLNKKYNADLRDPEAINFKKFFANKESSESQSPKPQHEAPIINPNMEFLENNSLHGAAIGGAIGVGLFTTAVACGIVVAPVAVVSVVAVGIVASSALAGALVYPSIIKLCNNERQN